MFPFICFSNSRKMEIFRLFDPLMLYCLERCIDGGRKRRKFHVYCFRWPFGNWPIADEKILAQDFSFWAFASHFCEAFCRVFTKLIRISWLCRINAQFTRIKILFTLNYCPCSFVCLVKQGEASKVEVWRRREFLKGYFAAMHSLLFFAHFYRKITNSNFFGVL